MNKVSPRAKVWLAHLKDSHKMHLREMAKSYFLNGRLSIVDIVTAEINSSEKLTYLDYLELGRKK